MTENDLDVLIASENLEADAPRARGETQDCDLCGGEWCEDELRYDNGLKICPECWGTRPHDLEPLGLGSQP